MEHLNEFELEVLENLPVEPIGLSLTELADGLLDDRSPAGKGKVRRALDRIGEALNGLHVSTGNDQLGGFGVKMYGIPRRTIPAEREFFVGQATIAWPSCVVMFRVQLPAVPFLLPVALRMCGSERNRF